MLPLCPQIRHLETVVGFRSCFTLCLLRGRLPAQCCGGLVRFLRSCVVRLMYVAVFVHRSNMMLVGNVVVLNVYAGCFTVLSNYVFGGFDAFLCAFLFPCFKIWRFLSFMSFGCLRLRGTVWPFACELVLSFWLRRIRPFFVHFVVFAAGKGTAELLPCFRCVHQCLL